MTTDEALKLAEAYRDRKIAVDALALAGDTMPAQMAREGHGVTHRRLVELAERALETERRVDFLLATHGA